MSQKNPDLIDQYLYIGVSVFYLYFWSFFMSLCSVTLWVYISVECIDIYYGTFTIIDFVTSGIMFIPWFFSMAMIVYSVRMLSEAHHIFMES